MDIDRDHSPRSSADSADGRRAWGGDVRVRRGFEMRFGFAYLRGWLLEIFGKWKGRVLMKESVL